MIFTIFHREETSDIKERNKEKKNKSIHKKKKKKKFEISIEQHS